MPSVDVICWHPFYGQSPADEDSKEYYYNYSTTIQAIKDTASAHGFTGEYFVDEMGWPAEGQPNPSGPAVPTLTQAAKYYARGVVMHLGLDVTVITGGTPPHNQPIYSTVKNLCTTMSGNRLDTFEVDIKSNTTNLKQYCFSVANGEKLLALWSDNKAKDYDPGVPATIKLPGFGNKKVSGIDVLNCFEQELITELNNDTLVIKNLLIKDYPIILRIGSTPVGVKDKNRSDTKDRILSIYPNPFYTNTTIKFELRERSEVNIKIYTIQGREIRDLVNRKYNPGEYQQEWNGQDNSGKAVPPGMYFIRMQSNTEVTTGKCLFLK
jgi:hypothetical protein